MSPIASASDAAVVAITYPLPLILLLAAYRLLFHPLANYPGPFLAKLTSAYTAFFAWRRSSHISTYRSLQNHGPVVRIAPNRLVFSTVTAVHDIYNNPKVTKGPGYYGSRMGKERPNMFNEADQGLHRKKRKTVGPAISERAMRSFEAEMSQEVDIFLALLLDSSRRSEVVDITPRCERLGVDIVGRLAFGFELKSQRGSTHRHVAEGIKARSAISSIYMSWPSLRILDPVITFLSPAHHKTDKDNLYKSLRTMIGTRMALPKDAKHDFYAQVAEAMPPDELWAEAILIIGAGGSTTATTMSAAFFYLSRNPKAYKRLVCEIRGAFSCGKDINQGPELISCTYLRAVVDEALRLSSGTISNWRIQATSSVAAGEQLVVDGYIIPPGTEVATNAYSFMRNAEYYPEPFTFLPERWIEADEQRRAIMRRAFIPFSSGSRSCAGQAMAYLELSLTIARTIWYFDFEKAPGELGSLGEVPGSPKEFKLEDSTIIGHHGPNLVLKTREDYWKELVAVDA